MRTLTILLLFVSAGATGQNLIKTGVLNIRLQSSGPIIQNDQVTGYYFFYNLEKKSKDKVNYLLSVFDENLQEISSTTIARPKTYTLIEGAFNGETFGFLGFESRSGSIELISFDKTLKQVGGTTKKVESKYSLAAYRQVAGGTDASQAYLIPVPNKGFMYYGGKEGNDSHFEMEFYNNNMVKVWSDKAADKADMEIAMEAFHDEEYVGSLIAKKRSKNSKDIEFDLIVHQVADGKRVFRAPAVTDKYTASISDVFHDRLNQRFVVFGEYYKKEDKALKAQSLGFLTLAYDMQGKLVYEKANSWAEDISRVTPMNEKGRLEGSKASVLFHEAIRTSDGQIFLVGELYKKAVSGAGVASQIFSIAAAVGTGYYSGNDIASVQLEVMDLVIFQFNPDYTINKLHIFEKSKNVILLPSGSTYLSTKMLSYYAKSVGGFDFAFSQVAADRSTFMVSYINYDRKSGQKSKNILGSVVYTPEKTFTTDKMEMSRKSTEYFVYRAKEGYILVTEYNKKEKKVESRLEKINY